MSSLSDLFVSFKNVDQPEITVPKYNPDIDPRTMVNPTPTMATKVQTAKKRTQDSAKLQPFKWGSGGAKDKPYEQFKPNTNYTIPKEQPLLPGNKKMWKTEMMNAYKRAGCSEEFAKNLVGQDALETSWGTKTVGDYNFGNIKKGSSWTGRTRTAHDKVENSNDAYRCYNSIDHYVQDKLALLKDKYKMTGQESAEEFTDKLVAGGYATDKDYKKVVLGVIKSV